ncbi:MAG TPA: hypothetical protein PK867_26330, partial [Pirellulales bacterium]|nr:hypothetical protein [Pirellulales bacterium]
MQTATSPELLALADAAATLARAIEHRRLAHVPDRHYSDSLGELAHELCYGVPDSLRDGSTREACGRLRSSIVSLLGHAGNSIEVSNAGQTFEAEILA